MKQIIRSFIVKIPLAKPLYKAIKHRREEQRMQREHDQLRKKQPIIRLGSPECFDGFPLLVSWDVTSYCNFRCSYCYHAGKEYKKDFCTLEQAETAIKHLASANRPFYQVNLVGGEPTTHPHLAEIISLLHKHLGDRLEMLQIITNGSFSESQIKPVLMMGEQANVKLSVSIHLEYMNVERVVELVKRHSLQTHLRIDLMFHPELIDKTMEMAETLCDLRRDYPFEIVLSMLREPPKFGRLDSRYTQEHFNCAERIRERFEKMSADGPKWHGNFPISFGSHFFVERKESEIIENYERLSASEVKDMTRSVFMAMTCCAGTSIAKIEVDGRVKGMICGLDSPSCNIFEENPFLREDWMHGIFCTRDMCGCSVNYRIPKFRSPVEAEKFIAEKRLEQKKLMGVIK